ncbi:MAG: hypothetical protein P1U82_29025 [Verrucomicrobiales bacterium]|jgi:hypothetical protein|nr:hypothetical protein [Verrucomicrobiales bacterium]
MTTNDPFWTRQADRPSTSQRQDYDYLLHRIEKLTLVNRALWEIIAKQHDCPKDLLVAKVAEIDLRDGELDQELHEPIIPCPKCGQKVNRRHQHCIYCGFDELPQDVFTSI